MDIAASPLIAAGVVTASLLGSTHCAAMCGGFACLYGGDAAHAHARSSGDGVGHTSAPLLTGHVAYHGGRLVAYTMLGALAASVGAGLDRLGALAGVQRLAGVVAGILLLAWGSLLLLHAYTPPSGMTRAGWITGLTTRIASASRGLTGGRVSDRSAHWIGSVLLRARHQSPGVRAGALGLLTGLIPCGWLWAFVVTAAGTGSMVHGALFMVLFWVGTVPALVIMATGMRYASGALRQRLPLVSAVVIIASGVAALSGRLMVQHPLQAPVSNPSALWSAPSHQTHQH